MFQLYKDKQNEPANIVNHRYTRIFSSSKLFFPVIIILLLLTSSPVYGKVYRISAGGRIRAVSWPEDNTIYLEAVKEDRNFRYLISTINKFDLNEEEMGPTSFLKLPILRITRESIS